MGDFTGKKSKRKQTTAMNQMNQQIQGQVKASEASQGLVQKQLDATRSQYEDFQFENPFEDMTVDMRAAEFQVQQGQQQRANIMQGLKGAAGSSGVAGLAQAMANKGQLQTQEIAAQISQQEQANQLKEREGQAAIQTAQAGRQSTLLGMDYGALAGANQAQQAALSNQMSGMGMKADMYGAQSQNNMFSTLVGAGAQVASGYLGGQAFADKMELKRNE